MRSLSRAGNIKVRNVHDTSSEVYRTSLSFSNGRGPKPVLNLLMTRGKVAGV